MKYVDYRDLLGIGFSDIEKGILFQNKVLVILDKLIDIEARQPDIDEICRKYFIEVGEISSAYYNLTHVSESLSSADNTKAILCKAVIFGNIYDSYRKGKQFTVIGAISKFLSDLNILYETINDDDGLFIIPTGAKELDMDLINEPLQWLSEYPSARKAMIKALKTYSDQENASECADAFRKGLETFFKEFLHTNKSLETTKKEYGTYMKEHGVPAELSNNFQTLLAQYNYFMNEYAKHNDKTDKKWLEFIMYQTFNIIRFVITLDK